MYEHAEDGFGTLGVLLCAPWGNPVRYRALTCWCSCTAFLKRSDDICRPRVVSQLGGGASGRVACVLSCVPLIRHRRCRPLHAMNPSSSDQTPVGHAVPYQCYRTFMYTRYMHSVPRRTPVGTSKAVLALSPLKRGSMRPDRQVYPRVVETTAEKGAMQLSCARQHSVPAQRASSTCAAQLSGQRDVEEGEGGRV